MQQTIYYQGEDIPISIQLKEDLDTDPIALTGIKVVIFAYTERTGTISKLSTETTEGYALLTLDTASTTLSGVLPQKETALFTPGVLFLEIVIFQNKQKSIINTSSITITESLTKDII